MNTHEHTRAPADSLSYTTLLPQFASCRCMLVHILGHILHLAGSACSQSSEPFATVIPGEMAIELLIQ
eukprot:9189025-Pyramimonas_sp.AAC.1